MNVLDTLQVIMKPPTQAESAAQLTLDALSSDECEIVRWWRNDQAARLGLRTPYVLTAEQQEEFYREVVCNRSAPHRYWAVRDPKYVDLAFDVGRRGLVGMGGLTDISWENGHAEISLIVAPNARGSGVGESAVGLLLREAFDRLRLCTVFAECYLNNPAATFWQRMAEMHGAETTTLPRRKYWQGRLYGSLLVAFTNDARVVVRQTLPRDTMDDGCGGPDGA